MNTRPTLLLVLMGLLLFSCKPKDEPSHQTTPYKLPTPLFFPTLTNIPPDNPMTEEGVALGEKLFSEEFGVRSKGFGVRNCASCHHAEYSYEFGPEGTLEHLGTHHTMLPLINLAWNSPVVFFFAIFVPRE